jgi:hypothetical protein
VDLKYHEEFIRHALRGLSFSDWAKGTIIVGNVTQDTLYFNEGKRHFDRKVKVRSSQVNIALNPNKSGYSHPLESDRGWGGGANPWDIIDGMRTYPEWQHGLAFTGGRMSYAGERCGIRQATINFGEAKTFLKVIIWHHGHEHIPKECNLQFWDGARWVDIISKREVDLQYTPPSGYGTTPDIHTFSPVAGSKVRYVFDNCKENILGKPNEHGWIYEFEVYGTDNPVHRRYFYRAKNYLLLERENTISRIGNRRYYYARLSLGRALHTLQDLFAHSNFIDLSDTERGTILAALGERADKDIPKSFKLTYFRFMTSQSGDEYPHDKYNKDKQGCQGFEQAKASAKMYSKEFVTKIREEVIRTHGLKKWKKFRGTD